MFLIIFDNSKLDVLINFVLIKKKSVVALASFVENIFLIDVVYVHIQVIHGVILLLRHEKRCRHTDTVLANVWGFGKFFVIITEFLAAVI